MRIGFNPTPLGYVGEPKSQVAWLDPPPDPASATAFGPLSALLTAARDRVGAAGRLVVLCRHAFEGGEHVSWRSHGKPDSEHRDWHPLNAPFELEAESGLGFNLTRRDLPGDPVVVEGGVGIVDATTCDDQIERAPELHLLLPSTAESSRETRADVEEVEARIPARKSLDRR